MNDIPNLDPTALPIPATVALTEHTVAALGELLSMCEEFLRTAGPLVHAELRGYLAGQYPPADPTWLIDMLGFQSVHLRHQLGPAAGSPRENHQPRHNPIDPVPGVQADEITAVAW